MSLVCSISNEVPEVPCVSPKSGHIFEKGLLEKYIKEHGKDPINNEPLSMEEVIDIKSKQVSKPKPPSATSIPALLKIFQDEWDASMLTNFSLKQNLNTTLQELSHSLYQHDAACRVISRLNKESSAAREALSSLKPESILPSGDAPQAMTVDEQAESGQPIGMSGEVIEKLQARADELTSERKKRGKRPPADLAKSDEIAQYDEIDHVSGLHSSTTPELLCLDVKQSNTNRVITGGADKNAVVYDRAQGKTICTLKGHTKRITSVLHHPTKDVAITASVDSQIRIWNVETSKCSAIIKTHSAGVTGLSLHPLGDYVLSGSTDRHWAFSDINTGKTFCRLTEATQAGVTCAKFHPDGVIFGTGHEDSQVRMWDMKAGSNVADFPSHNGKITSISFSENGYYLATGAEDHTVKLWDLRKLKNFRTLQMEENYDVRTVQFDQSGTYLAVAGTDVRVYLSKQWSELARFRKHTAVATGIAFGRNAEYIASTSYDRSLKFYGLKQ